MPIIIDHTPGFAHLASGLGQGVENFNDARDLQRQRANDQEIHELKKREALKALEVADQVEVQRAAAAEALADQARSLARGLPGLEEGVFGPPTEEGMTKRRLARMGQLIEVAGPELGASILEQEMTRIKEMHSQAARTRYGERITELMQNPNLPEMSKQELGMVLETLNDPETEVVEAQREADRVMRRAHTTMTREMERAGLRSGLESMGAPPQFLAALDMGTDPEFVERAYFGWKRGGGADPLAGLLGEETGPVQAPAQAAEAAAPQQPFSALPADAQAEFVDAVIAMRHAGMSVEDVFNTLGVDPASIPQQVLAQIKRKAEARKKGSKKADALGLRVGAAAAPQAVLSGAVSGIRMIEDAPETLAGAGQGIQALAKMFPALLKRGVRKVEGKAAGMMRKAVQ